MKTVPLLILVLMAFTSASSPDSTFSALHEGTNTFGVSFASAFSVSIISSLTQEERAERGFLVAGFHYGRIFSVKPSIALQYTIEVYPMILATGTSVTGPDETHRETLYGFGIAPLGVQVNFHPRSRVQPFITFSCGILQFEKDYPEPDSNRFNFTADGGPGLQFFTRDNQSYIGYKYHHISNAKLSAYNPGFNHFIAYFGFQILKTK